MSVGSSASALATGLVYRVTGWRAAGERLVDALESDDENTRQIAGTFLVRKGERSRALLEHAVEQGRGGIVADVLDDLDGTASDLAELEELARSDNPKIAEAARNLLEKRKGS